MTKEQFQLWKSLPETQEILELQHKQITLLKDYLGLGGCIHPESIEATMIETIGTIGRIKGLSTMFELDFEEDDTT